MAAGTGIPQDHHIAVYPPEPVPGAIGVIVSESRLSELKELEAERTVRVWRVRGIVSDHIPLAGGSDAAIARPPQHLFFLNENPLSIYLHRGGDDATYFDFVGDSNGYLQYIEVQVETNLPSNAFLLARRLLNEMLDAFVRSNAMPLLFKRLEVMSPRDGKLLAYEMILPYRDGVKFGPLGGILQWPPFAPYDAIYREAITSTSPFYQLLCAHRVYEGTNQLRKWMREQCERFNIQERMPGDLKVNPEELTKLGIDAEVVVGVRTASDLFEKFREHRNAIAHFLIEGDEGQAHVYLADGEAYLTYSLGAAVLLRYAHLTIVELRKFYTQHLEGRLMRGMILPMPEIRDRFVVRDPQLNTNQPDVGG